MLLWLWRAVQPLWVDSESTTDTPLTCVAVARRELPLSSFAGSSNVQRSSFTHRLQVLRLEDHYLSVRIVEFVGPS